MHFHLFKQDCAKGWATPFSVQSYCLTYLFYFIATYKTFELQHMNQLLYMCMKIVPYKFCYIMITLSYFFSTRRYMYILNFYVSTEDI